MKKIAILAALLLAATAHASVRISDMSDDDGSSKILKKVKPAAPVTLSPAEIDTLNRAIAKDRSDTEIWLQTSPTSYLAAIARRDFGNRNVLTIGTDPSNDLRVDDPGVKPRHLRVTVSGDSFRVESVDPEAHFVQRGDSLRSAVVGPSAIQVGRFTMRLSHQRYPAIIVFDPQSPRLPEYKGLSWYPVDFRFRYVMPLTVNPEPDTVEVLSTHSQPRQAVRAGWFVFAVDGKKCVLEVHRLVEPGVGENDLSIFFRDATSGKDTYEIGRYVEPERQPDGNYVLDFNNAYNPACATSPHYNCPIPSKFNKLKVKIQAGEKDHHYMAKK